MTTKEEYTTDQEKFWAGRFGTEYIRRNESDQLLASNLNFFSKALQSTEQIASCLEFGANIGMNLKALKLLYPKMSLKGIEINKEAAEQLAKILGDGNVQNGSIFSCSTKDKVDLALIKGVLIHINPDKLQAVYEKLYEVTNKYILVAEYYNPSPMAIPYRDHNDRLFKRDFAGELLDKYSDLRLIDYGFAYHRDSSFPQDDITWFLLEKGM